MNYIDGLYFEILSDGGKNKEYNVSFLRNDGTPIYELTMGVNTWAKLEMKYLLDVNVVVKSKIGTPMLKVNCIEEMKHKKVFISFDSSSLGDTLAWMPYCQEFAHYYKCRVVVSTFHNNLFEDAYPDLQFVGRGKTVYDLFGMFNLGWHYDKQKEPVNPATIPLQKAATNILCLPYEEMLPKLSFKPLERPMVGKYVAIAVHSTSGLKLWPYWQIIVDYLNDEGYKVIEISKITKDHKSWTTQVELTDIIQLEDTSMENTMNVLYHADFYLGLSSGLSWLAWALQKQVIMVANFTNKEHEFAHNCIRITDETVCNSCWNDPMFKFDKSNWTYCPRNEDTPQQFECHTAIKPQVVIDAIKQIEEVVH